jgi:hypothetical protein
LHWPFSHPKWGERDGDHKGYGEERYVPITYHWKMQLWFFTQSPTNGSGAGRCSASNCSNMLWFCRSKLPSISLHYLLATHKSWDVCIIDWSSPCPFCSVRCLASPLGQARQHIQHNEQEHSITLRSWVADFTI